MITVSGILKTPAGQVLANTEIKFFAVATASNVLQGTTGIINTGSDGSYSVTLQQGSHRVTVRQGNTRPEAIGTVHISVDTTATTLNELLLAASAASPGNPLADEVLAARDRAEAAAIEANATRAAVQTLHDSTQELRDQTSEISGLSTVAEAIAAVQLPEPDVLITFNDGLRIERGYGTHDTIDVSAAQDGSKPVQLPSRSVDFSRASGSTYINKSGELVTLGNDQPVIGPDGLQVFGSATNLALWSEDFGNSAWGKRSGSHVIVNTDEVIDPYGTNLADKHVNTDTETNQSYIAFAPAFEKDNTDYCASVFVKRGSAPTAKLIMFSKLSNNDRVEMSFDYATGVVSITNAGSVTDAEGGMIKCNNGWYRLWLSANMLAGGSGTGVRLIPSFWYLPDAIGSEYGYIFGGQLEEGKYPSPYIRTEGSAVTRSPDIASIPVRNNLPAPGKPFTIVVDADVPDSGIRRYLFLQTGTTDNDNIFIRREPSGELLCNVGTGTTTNYFLLGDQTTGIHRYVIRFNGSNVSTFVDGGSLMTRPPLPVAYDVSKTLKIGSTGSSGFLGSSISNFRIYLTALSDEQIAALGGPQ